MKSNWTKPEVTVITLELDKEMGAACFTNSGNQLTTMNAACDTCNAPKCWSNNITTYSGEKCAEYRTF